VDHVRLTGEDERSPWLSVSPRGSFFSLATRTSSVLLASGLRPDVLEMLGWTWSLSGIYSCERRWLVVSQ